MIVGFVILDRCDAIVYRRSAFSFRAESSRRDRRSFFTNFRAVAVGFLVDVADENVREQE